MLKSGSISLSSFLISYSSLLYLGVCFIFTPWSIFLFQCTILYLIIGTDKFSFFLLVLSSATSLGLQELSLKGGHCHDPGHMTLLHVYILTLGELVPHLEYQP